MLAYKGERSECVPSHYLKLHSEHISVMESYDLNSESASMGSRKGRKLLAEKKRRARMNLCLNEIKNVVCSTQKQDPNYEKMEKAEILETTVDYLRNVRKINTTHQQVKETVQDRFQQGFSRCAEEILTYIQSLPGVSDNVQHQLRKHLSRRLNHIQQVPVTSSQSPVTSYSNQWYDRLGSVPLQHPHPFENAYLNSSACTSPVRKEISLEDSGYGGSPESLKYSKNQMKSDSASDSELCRLEVRYPNQKFNDARVSAWVQSTLSYSQQVKMEQQAPWRPW